MLIEARRKVYISEGVAMVTCREWLVVRLKRELHWTKLFYRDRDWRNIAFCPVKTYLNS